jgi:hypothetical protein
MQLLPEDMPKPEFAIGTQILFGEEEKVNG